MNIARIAGLALMAGIALFLISVLAKVLIVGGLVLFALRAVGRQIARRYYGYGSLGRDRWATPEIISIDNPAYRSPMNRPQFDRIISIS